MRAGTGECTWTRVSTSPAPRRLKSLSRPLSWLTTVESTALTWRRSSTTERGGEAEEEHTQIDRKGRG